MLKKLGIGNDEEHDDNKSEHLRNIIVDCMRHLQTTLDSLLSRLDDIQQLKIKSFELWGYAPTLVYKKIKNTFKKISNLIVRKKY